MLLTTVVPLTRPCSIYLLFRCEMLQYRSDLVCSPQLISTVCVNSHRLELRFLTAILFNCGGGSQLQTVSLPAISFMNEQNSAYVILPFSLQLTSPSICFSSSASKCLPSLLKHSSRFSNVITPVLSMSK